jgi:MoaA/NifB/PqqE/SkfB family radical SAM enzyme
MEISKVAYNNAILNLSECRDKTPILTSYPLKLYIEPTSLCNLQCSYCYPVKDRSNKSISLDMFKALEQQLFEHVCEVNLFLSGEPTLHKKFSEMLEICARYPLITKFFTNLSYKNDAILEKMVETGAWVNVSFDGLHKNIFRNGVDEIQVIRNLIFLIGYNERIKNNKFHLRIATVVGKHNIDSLCSIVTWVARMNIKEIMLGCLDAHGELERFRLTAEDAILFDKAIYRANLLGVRISTPSHIGGVKLKKTHNWDDFSVNIDTYFPHFCEDCNPDVDGKFCPYPWIQTIIEANGNVVSCCQGKIIMGKFSPEVDFIKDIWNNTLFQEIRTLENYNNCGSSKGYHCNMMGYSIWGGERRLKNIPEFI